MTALFDFIFPHIDVLCEIASPFGILYEIVTPFGILCEVAESTHFM